MLPAALGPYLQEIFEVFGRLASYHHQLSLSSTTFISTTVPNVIDKNYLHLIHLQVNIYNYLLIKIKCTTLVITQPLQIGLCSLFHRLYALYPCNFISYLKQQYSIQRESQREAELKTFTHTIRPMLESVRMHPLLVTASKDAEISTNRYICFAIYVKIFHVSKYQYYCYKLTLVAQ